MGDNKNPQNSQTVERTPEFILNLTKKQLQDFAIQMYYEILEFQKICYDVKKIYPNVHEELIMERLE